MKTPIHNSANAATDDRSGVTIVELLVVVSIIAVLSAVLIPRLRTLNKDRNIREAARVVGAVFNSASQRARVEGTGGVAIITNPNLTDSSTGGQVPFGGTVLYQLRKLPAYTGDFPASPAAIVTAAPAPLVIRIPMPFEHEPNASPPRNFIRVHDTIQLGGSKVRYRISAVPVPPTGSTTLDLFIDQTDNSTPTPPRPAVTNVGPFPTFSFRIERQPRVLRSSRTELPAGYIIDMRYSGPTQMWDNVTDAANPVNVPAALGTLFNQELRTTVIYFGQSGGIDRIDVAAQVDAAGNVSTTNHVCGAPNNGRVANSLSMLVTEYDPNPTQLTIDRDNSLWVTVEQSTGTVNVGVNNPRPLDQQVAVSNLSPTIDINDQDQLRARSFTPQQINSARADAGAYGAAQ